jgi:hypothetical protein
MCVCTERCSYLRLANAVTSTHKRCLTFFIPYAVGTIYFPCLLSMIQYSRNVPPPFSLSSAMLLEAVGSNWEKIAASLLSRTALFAYSLHHCMRCDRYAVCSALLGYRAWWPYPPVACQYCQFKWSRMTEPWAPAVNPSLLIPCSTPILYCNLVRRYVHAWYFWCT